jgi:hypothetical protein
LTHTERLKVKRWNTTCLGSKHTLHGNPSYSKSEENGNKC